MHDPNAVRDPFCEDARRAFEEALYGAYESVANAADDLVAAERRRAFAEVGAQHLLDELLLSELLGRTES